MHTFTKGRQRAKGQVYYSAPDCCCRGLAVVGNESGNDSGNESGDEGGCKGMKQ
jgi:hypothetical protein